MPQLMHNRKNGAVTLPQLCSHTFSAVLPHFLNCALILSQQRHCLANGLPLEVETARQSAVVSHTTIVRHAIDRQQGWRCLYAI